MLPRTKEDVGLWKRNQEGILVLMYVLGFSWHSLQEVSLFTYVCITSGLSPLTSGSAQHLQSRHAHDCIPGPTSAGRPANVSLPWSNLGSEHCLSTRSRKTQRFCRCNSGSETCACLNSLVQPECNNADASRFIRPVLHQKGP